MANRTVIEIVFFLYMVRGEGADPFQTMAEQAVIAPFECVWYEGAFGRVFGWRRLRFFSYLVT
jgi:hypothetical protein